MKQDCRISFQGVDLVYDLHYDRTNTIKELLINLVTRRSYVGQRLGKLFALREVNLEIGHGERVGIVGLNGAGKSTLLKVLARLLKPTGGRIDVDGTVQPLIELGAGFNAEFTGRENIYLNGAMLGFSKREMKAKEAEIVEFAELKEFIDVPVKYYSSGMIVRLAFTIATSVKPEILVLDEMLSAGDHLFIEKARVRIRRLLDDSKILVLVSHDLSLLRQLVERVVVLDCGRVIFDGPTEEALGIYESKKSRSAE
jgi:lipopolysaccharide transport system ATP-binding protein